jgi:hypothetical protein
MMGWVKMMLGQNDVQTSIKLPENRSIPSQVQFSPSFVVNFVVNFVEERFANSSKEVHDEVHDEGR